MKPILTLVAALLVLGATAQAGEVYKQKDAKGNPVFTDRPEQLPAERLNVKTHQTDPAEAQRRHDEEMDRLNAASSSSSASPASSEASSEDKAKRCKDARDRYEQYMSARRLYEQGGSEGERRYLSDAEMEATRANAKKVMDEFCAGQ